MRNASTNRMATGAGPARRRLGALTGAVAAVALLGAGCSSGDDQDAVNAVASASSVAAAASPSPQPLASPNPGATTAQPAGAPFGTACPTAAAGEPGSLESMATEPVATAAAGNPNLTKLTSAIEAAELKDPLNNAEALTVFAPTNEAFDKVDADTLAKVLADPQGQLTNVLNYHVVQGRLGPDEFAGQHRTVQGGTVSVSGSGEEFKVNEATVVCGNVQTANATVYIIDAVLMPSA